MSERILKALMQLFAIVAKIDVIKESDEIVAAETSKKIVEILLKQDLNSELVTKYLKIFDQFIKERHGTKRVKDSKKKRTSVNSVKVLRIVFLKPFAIKTLSVNNPKAKALIIPTLLLNSAPIYNIYIIK